jgi:hypothetical protein
MYKYKLRPGYQSKQLLIEFVLKAVDDEFLECFYQTLEPIHPQQIKVTDLWMNDEVMIMFESDLGGFEMSIDNYGDVFIMAPINQAVIIKIDELISSHDAFEKLEVDMDEYK